MNIRRLASALLCTVLVACSKNDELDVNSSRPTSEERQVLKSGYHLEPEASHFMDVLLADDISHFLEGHQTLISRVAGYIVVAVDEVASTYSANEIDGDLKYKGKALLVSGTAADVMSDFRDMPAVTFRGENDFMAPMALISDDDIGRIAKIRKGERVVLSCVGGGEIAGRPIFNDCKFPENIVKSEVKSLKEKMPEYLSGREAVPELILSMIATSVLSANLIKTGEVKCESEKDISCVYKVGDFLSKNKEKESVRRMLGSIKADLEKSGVVPMKAGVGNSQQPRP